MKSHINNKGTPPLQVNGPEIEASRRIFKRPKEGREASVIYFIAEGACVTCLIASSFILLCSGKYTLLYYMCCFLFGC